MKKEKEVQFFSLKKVVTGQEFISSIPAPKGSLGLIERFEAIKDKKIEIQN